MSNGASALVAQRIKAELDDQGKSLTWLAEESGRPRETVRRKVGQESGDLTMGEIIDFARALNLNAGYLVQTSLAAVA